MDVFLEETNCKYQCIGGALRRAQACSSMMNPARISEATHAAQAQVSGKTTVLDDGEWV